MRIVTDETGLVLTPQDSKPTEGSNVTYHNASAPITELEAAIASLTRRERQTLELLGKGLSNKAIAERLGGLSPWTVKSHVSVVLAKLDAVSRWEAAQRYAAYMRGQSGAIVRGA